MDGIFQKKKMGLTMDVLGIIAGAFLSLLFLFLLFVDSEMTENTYELVMGIFMICFGIIATVCCVVSLLFNRGAYLHMTDDHISAKFNWNKGIVCYYNEIAFVDCAYFSLSIRLKNGKRYTIMNLLNAVEICDVLRKKIYANMTAIADKDTLLSEIDSMTSKRKKQIILLITLGVFMFLGIFICVFLTGGKEFLDFAHSDWSIFITFLVTELLVLIALFYMANKVGKELPLINEKKTQLRKLILETSPALPGNPLSMYLDSAYQKRATVFIFPNSEDVYFCVETVDNHYDLQCIYESPVYESIEELKPMLDELIKIE